VGKAVLKKSAAKAARPVAGKPAKSGAPVSKAVSGKAAAGRTIPAAKAPAAKPAKAAIAKPVAAGKTAPVAKVATAAKSVKAAPAPVTAKKPIPAAAAKVNGSHKAESKSRIETKPERNDKPMQRVEQVSSSGDSKPKKNQAGMSSKELEFFRDLLLAKRRELVGDMSSMEREALQSGDSGLSTLPIHMADMGTDNYEQEFTLGLVEKDRNLLREINHALAKIQNGTYGICEGNGKPIAKVRLEAQPWARFSIEFARMQERGGMR
jgi:RNA polymerase-binding protein DksA